MQSRLKRSAPIVALALAASLGGRIAHAQSVVFPENYSPIAGATPIDPRFPYTLLNGENLALYISDLGYLGAPAFQFGSSLGALSKTDIHVNADGSVNIPLKSTSTGQPINTGPNADQYGILYNPGGINNSSLQSSIQSKFEYATANLSHTATEQWGVKVSSPTTSNWLFQSNLTDVALPQAPKASGNSVSAQLVATNIVDTGDVTVSQRITFNGTSDNKNVARVDVVFHKNGAGDPITVRYARTVNPGLFSTNPGSNPDATTQTIGTTKQSAFAINASTVDTNLNTTGNFSDPTSYSHKFFETRNLGLGVQPTDNGSTILDPNTGKSVPVTITGMSILALPDLSLDPDAALTDPNSTTSYITLGANGSAVYHQGGNAGTVKDFANFTDISTTDSGLFSSSQSADDYLMLLSPDMTLTDANPDAAFTFYYFFDLPVNGAGAVPEPGTAALIVSGLAAACGLAVRRRLRK